MKGNILVVDDSTAIRKAIRFILEKEEFAVTEASNGTEGIQKINPDINLIISDINMPEMDGIEMIKNIREGPYKTIPIIILTTVSEEELVQKAKEIGATAWLLKPFKPENLINTISKVLG